MSEFVVVAFPNEKMAYQGLHALAELHEQGGITLYNHAVIQRGEDGSASVKEKQSEVPADTGMGALLGGLVGMFGGPAGMAIGIGAGAALGAARGLLNLGLSDKFLTKISTELSPGRTAVVAEVSEEWVTPLDSRMEALGGVVMREWRDDFIEDEIEKRIAKCKAELAQRRAELTAVKAEKVEAMKRHVGEAEQALRAAAEDASARMKRDREEAEAKIKALQEQATKARADAKARIDARIAEIRADQKQRVGKLEQAWKLTQEALRPGP